MLTKPDSALVIAGHGSTLNPDSSASTWDLAEDIRRRGVFGEVHCAFWKEEPSFRQVLHCVDREDVYVVPNFISEGYFTKTVIPREIGIGGLGEGITRVGRHAVKYCEPVGNHSRMTELLLKRATAIAPGKEIRHRNADHRQHHGDLVHHRVLPQRRQDAAHQPEQQGQHQGVE